MSFYSDIRRYFYASIKTSRAKWCHSILSEHGKEAVIALLEPRDFFSEECLAAQLRRTTIVSAMMECVIVRMEKEAINRLLRDEPESSGLFISYLLGRSARLEADLAYQLLNSSEKRLARFLLRMAHLDDNSQSVATIPKISQETLADMIGTTRSRVNFFMNKFRQLGFIDYSNDRLEIHRSLLSVTQLS